MQVGHYERVRTAGGARPVSALSTAGISYRSPLSIRPEKGLSMDGMYELFRNKPQEIISMKVYYELGELDFAQLKQLAMHCPKYQAIVDQSFRVGEPKKCAYFLVPVELVLEACNG